jgi:hypothetical protein
MRRFRVGREYRVKDSNCLACGELCTAASGVDVKPGADRPEPGRITVCLFCGHIMAFAEDMSMRELTNEEARDVAGDPRILALQWARQFFQKEKK